MRICQKHLFVLFFPRDSFRLKFFFPRRHSRSMTHAIAFFCHFFCFRCFLNELCLYLCRSGTTTSLNGTQMTTAAWTHYMCHLNIFGCRIQFCIISKLMKKFLLVLTKSVSWSEGKKQTSFRLIIVSTLQKTLEEFSSHYQLMDIFLAINYVFFPLLSFPFSDTFPVRMAIMK